MRFPIMVMGPKPLAKRKGDKAMRYLWLALLAPLTACSYTTFITGADEHGGTVNFVTHFTEDGALDAANDHCQQFGKVARIAHNDPASNTMTFTCEPPEERPHTRK